MDHSSLMLYLLKLIYEPIIIDAVFVKVNLFIFVNIHINILGFKATVLCII